MSPRAPAATTVGTRDIVRRLDEERFSRNVDRLRTGSAVHDSPHSSPRPSPRTARAQPDRRQPSPTGVAQPNVGAGDGDGPEPSPRRVPSTDGMRDRLYQPSATADYTDGGAAARFTPLSSATRSSAGVTGGPARNEHAERITAELAASYRTLSAGKASPRDNSDGDSDALHALQTLKLHVANVVDHALASEVRTAFFRNTDI